MPLPNGVSPLGHIAAICPSAGWMGNRGVLHDEHGRLVRASQRKAWLTCAIAYKGRNRQPLMQPRRYTELFFLDEATAFAAGHRPCAECRNRSYKAFKQHWLKANGRTANLSAKELDACLHAERMNRAQDGAWMQPLPRLPAGVIVYWNDALHLWTGASLKPWTTMGYGPAVDIGDNGASARNVRLCTPPSIVNAIADGYAVQMHDSATRIAPAPDRR
jgi:hypothetical protein